MRRRVQKMGRQRGVALLVTTVSIAVIGAAVGDFAYNSRVDLEAAANSRDTLRAEFLARSSMQLGQLLVGVQNAIQKQLQALPPQMREFADSIVITDYANFLVQAFGGDAEARAGLGGLLGLDLASAQGLGSGKGATMELTIESEEGRFFVNCGGGVNALAQDRVAARRSMYLFLNALIRPPRYNRMFNVADRDGVVITYEDLPRAIIDWTDVDNQRYEPEGNASASEDRYDRGRDRYEAHNQYMDTLEELLLVRGVSEDFWAAFGEMFTIYGAADCKVLAAGITAEAWPLVAGMIAASSPNPAVAFEPNTQLVAQQVAGILKVGLPLLKGMRQSNTLQIQRIPVDAKQCPGSPAAAPPPPGGGLRPGQGQPPGAAPGAGDAIELLSDLISSSAIAQLPGLAQGLSSLSGSSAPKLQGSTLRPIPLCPGRLGGYLKERAGGGGGFSGGQGGRRFFRLDARGTIQRNEKKSTQVHIRGVWDAQSYNSNPLCSGPTCVRGTWAYWRMD